MTTNSSNDNSHKGTLDRPNMDGLVPSLVLDGAKFASNGTNQPKITLTQFIMWELTLMPMLGCFKRPSKPMGKGMIQISLTYFVLPLGMQFWNGGRISCNLTLDAHLQSWR